MTTESFFGQGYYYYFVSVQSEEKIEWYFEGWFMRGFFYGEDGTLFNGISLLKDYWGMGRVKKKNEPINIDLQVDLHIPQLIIFQLL